MDSSPPLRSSFPFPASAARLTPAAARSHAIASSLHPPPHLDGRTPCIASSISAYYPAHVDIPPAVRWNKTSG
jgi:hypothetical protein